jgi:hypothetical protein
VTTEMLEIEKQLSAIREEIEARSVETCKTKFHLASTL